MKPIRVALSGSGFKFPAHVGALTAIEDAGFEVVEFAGTSGGSIVAALAACGMSLDIMRDLTMSRDWSDMLSCSPWSLITNIGYCSGSNLLAWLEENTRGKTFAEVNTKLSIVASDLVTEQEFIFSKATTPYTQIALAARASASIPFVYSPVQVNSALLMDGGLVNNIPVDQLEIDDVPRIGIQLLSKTPMMHDGTYSALDVVPRIMNLMLSSNENTHIDVAKLTLADVVFVETGYVSSLNRNMSREERQRLMNDGYEETAKVIAKISATLSKR